jgi:single-strand DNA-binding protein
VSESPAVAVAPDPTPRNEVTLVGRLGADPVPVDLPSGDTKVAFRLTVARPPSRPAPGRRTAAVDSVPCAAWEARVRRVVLRWSAGDVVEVTGALHRRWRSDQGTPTSAFEVRVDTARRLRKAQ